MLQRQEKKDEFRKLVGEIDMDSIFSEVKEEIKKDKVNSVKTRNNSCLWSWLFSETEQEKELLTRWQEISVRRLRLLNPNLEEIVKRLRRECYLSVNQGS